MRPMPWGEGASPRKALSAKQPFAEFIATKEKVLE